MIFRIALAWLALSTAASAQTPSTVRLCNGTQPNCPLVGATNGLPVNIVSGGTGGGAVTIADGADVAEGAVADAAATAGSAGTVSAKLRFLTSVAYATSTNQTSQITQETAINTILGLQADAACATDNGTCTIAALQKRGNQRLTTINTTLGSPFQAGGSIGNTTFGATQGTSPWVVSNGGTFPTQSAVTAASGSYASGSIASGAMVDLGAIADAAATAGSTGSVSAKLRLATTQLSTINTTLGTPMQTTGGTVGLVAGTAIAGKFGIDQTTPGTTNGAAIVGVNAATTLAGNGGTGTGSLRVTIANDNTLPSGWASSTAANQTATQAPVAPATATATKSDLVGCQATSAGINPTTGQQAALDCDLNNNLLVSAGGAPNLSISQVSVATSDTAVVSARALRRAVTIQQITGTQNVFCNQTTATAGNGVVLPAVVGASFTFNTTSSIRCIAITGAQTVAVAETF